MAVMTDRLTSLWSHLFGHELPVNSLPDCLAPSAPWLAAMQICLLVDLGAAEDAAASTGIQVDTMSTTSAPLPPPAPGLKVLSGGAGCGDVPG